jgi:hypothetical protein
VGGIHARNHEQPTVPTTNSRRENLGSRTKTERPDGGDRQALGVGHEEARVALRREGRWEMKISAKAKPSRDPVAHAPKTPRKTLKEQKVTQI